MPIISDYLHSQLPDIAYLLEFVLKYSTAQLYTNANNVLTAKQQQRLQQLIKKRQKGVPLAQLIKKKCFYNLDFYINEFVLIPRPESEILVDIALQHLNTSGQKTVLELATGSGAIIANLANTYPHHHYLATDKSQQALKVAHKNLQNHQLPQVQLIQSDWFSAIKPAKQFDFIIANPPYIAPDDPHLAALQHEPMSALVAENNGLANLKTIVRLAQNYLKKNAYLLLEHGFDQQFVLCQLLQSKAYKTQCFDDLSGQNRAILAQMG